MLCQCEPRLFQIAFGLGWYIENVMSRILLPLFCVSLLSVSSTLRGQEPEPAQQAQVKSALELLPSELVNAKGEKVSKDSLKGKIVGLYFSAHWCPPCRAFTPNLVAFRDTHSSEFEVVFVSSDKNEEAMKGYMTEMKMQWLAVPFSDSAVSAIKQHFGIRGIPTLIILGADGQVITKNGRADVTQQKDAALASWKHPKPAAAPTPMPAPSPAKP